LLIAKQSATKRRLLLLKKQSQTPAHTVSHKETVYGIRKTYDITDEDLKLIHFRKDGLQLVK
jgi:hypothetical protein